MNNDKTHFDPCAKNTRHSPPTVGHRASRVPVDLPSSLYFVIHLSLNMKMELLPCHTLSLPSCDGFPSSVR